MNDLTRNLVDRVVDALFEKDLDPEDFVIRECSMLTKCGVISKQPCGHYIALVILPDGPATYPGGFACLEHGLVGWIEAGPEAEALAALMNERTSETLATNTSAVRPSERSAA